MVFYRATKGAACFVLLGLLLSALSCSNPTPSPKSSPAPAPTASPTPVFGSVEIKISGFAFSPVEVTIKTGTKVTWTNQDTVPHTITADDKLFDSGAMAKDATYSYTFASKGTYSYYCAFHASMKGKINVVE